MGVFDILGPIMVGPSSSHTAGAVRIGNVARKLLGCPPQSADILLCGSFAATGKGHGTDKALVAGLLGMSADDMRIPDSFEIAKERNLSFTFGAVTLRDAHPNTAMITARGADSAVIEVVAASVGGGQISVRQIDGIDMSFSADSPTLIIRNSDLPGRVALVSGALSEMGVNIATMQLFRSERGGYAVMVIETDEHIDAACIDGLRSLEGVIKVTYIDNIDGGDVAK